MNGFHAIRPQSFSPLPGHSSTSDRAACPLDTIERPLLAWLDKPAMDRGIQFGQWGEQWEFWTYARLADLTRRCAAGLVDAGIRKDDVVAILCRSGPEFVAAFFGSLLVGGTPAPIASAIIFQKSEAYRDYLTGVLKTARPTLVVTQSDLVDNINKLATPVGVRALTIEELATAGLSSIPSTYKPADFALLQFTSGSSGRARGVCVTFNALQANVQAIRNWLDWTEDDAFASWLPLHHDMGLIGGLISSIVSRSNLWLLRPEQFIRRPLLYLRCFGAFGAKLTVTPGFGFDLIARRITPNELAGLDFSGWKGAVIGAERIDHSVLEKCYRLLSPFGFRRRVFLPAYGLAEATLAVTGLPLEEEWSAVTVDPSTLSPGHEVGFQEKESEGQSVVSCGRPLDGVSVDIIGEQDQPLAEGQVGEIVVEGLSVASGYVAETETFSSTIFSEGRLRTGDAGFLKDGQLFVLGRFGDSLKVRGRLIFAEDLEVLLSSVLDIPRQRLVALLGIHRGVPTAVVVFENFNEQWLAKTESLVRYHTGGAESILIDASSGTIARTSSGKPKRRELWRAFIKGTLPGKSITTPH